MGIDSKINIIPTDEIQQIPARLSDVDTEEESLKKEGKIPLSEVDLISAKYAKEFLKPLADRSVEVVLPDSHPLYNIRSGKNDFLDQAIRNEVEEKGHEHLFRDDIDTSRIEPIYDNRGRLVYVRVWVKPGSDLKSSFYKLHPKELEVLGYHYALQKNPEKV